MDPPPTIKVQGIVKRFQLSKRETEAFGLSTLSHMIQVASMQGLGKQFYVARRVARMCLAANS